MKKLFIVSALLLLGHELWAGSLSLGGSGTGRVTVSGAASSGGGGGGVSVYPATSPITVPGLTVDSLSGVLKATTGLVSGSATTSDVPEGSNQYFTTARSTTAVSASAPLTYGNGVFGVDGSSVTLLGPSIDLGSAEASGTLAAAYFPALTGNVTTSAGSLTTTIASIPSTVLVSSFPITGVTAGTYGSATQVSSFTINAQGIIAGAANVTISLTNSNLQSGTYSNVTVPAANVATGFLGGSVVASSVAVSAVQDASIVGVSSSKLSGPLPATVLASSFPITGVTAGSYTNTSLTVDAQGRISAASNGTGGGGIVSLSTGVTGRLPQSNQTFSMMLDPLRCKLLSPGTTNFPTMDNSTTTSISSLYWDPVSTQTVTWTQILSPYSGGSLFADFTWAASSVTSGNVQWSVFVKCNGPAHQVNPDNLFQAYTLDVSTGGAMGAVAGLPQRFTTGALTLNNSCAEGDEIGVLVTRNHNIASDAVGTVRLYPSRIHEN